MKDRQEGDARIMAQLLADEASEAHREANSEKRLDGSSVDTAVDCAKQRGLQMTTESGDVVGVYSRRED